MKFLMRANAVRVGALWGRDAGSYTAAGVRGRTGKDVARQVGGVDGAVHGTLCGMDPGQYHPGDVLLFTHTFAAT
jgi:outer membrane lipoprotein SlyB